MIPYVKIPSLTIYGPIGIHPFGVLVATGILLGTWIALRRSRQARISLDEIRSAVLWSIVAGFVGAHLVEALFYTPERLAREGWIYLFKIWDGISSFGGFIGGFLGLMTFLLLLRKPILGHVDVVLQAFVVAWIFGRLGCTLAFDHPGCITDFFLAMPYPGDGQPRHNLGFYEFLYTALVMLPVQLILHRLKVPPGSHVTAVFLTYCPARFYFDFLRASDLAGSDPRHGGLTPAQWGCILFFAVGLLLVFVIRFKARTRMAVPQPDASANGEESPEGTDREVG